MFDLKAHLKSLVEAHAPSGHEAPVRALVRESWHPLVDTFKRDGLGSLIGIKRGTQTENAAARRTIMLAAHMDEIGLMVRDVVDGFIFVHRITGVDNRVMLAQPVIVHGKQPLKGVVAAKPPHLLTAAERKRYPSFNQMVIDVGLPADEVADLVQIGDLITPDTLMLELQGKHIAAKAFDDRACIAAVTFCLHELQRLQHSWDVYAAATVQEESGLLGATTAANYMKPDVAIALDVGFAPQAGVPADESIDMGSGPSIALGANIHPKLFDKIIEVAKEYEIKYQTEAIPSRTGTDAWAIQVAQEGIPTALLSLPIRNMHSPVETLDLRDIERTGRLLALFIASLDTEFLSAIEFDDLKEKEGADA